MIFAAEPTQLRDVAGGVPAGLGGGGVFGRGRHGREDASGEGEDAGELAWSGAEAPGVFEEDPGAEARPVLVPGGGLLEVGAGEVPAAEVEERAGAAEVGDWALGGVPEGERPVAGRPLGVAEGEPGHGP